MWSNWRLISYTFCRRENFSPDPFVVNKLEFVGFMRARYFTFVIGKQDDLRQVQYK